IVKLVSAYLQPEGYEVHTAADGPAGLKAARTFRPDVVVLDVMLPGMDGLELLSRLRRESHVYVILLTARTEETDKLVGLGVGADDYVTKPFSPRELVARVHAVLRRAHGGSPGNVIRVADLTIDVARLTVTRGSTPIELTTTEFELLSTMARHPGR